ncbi:MAG: MarR family transcriptional regulator [Flavobacteriales bacterium]|nr:MarR family transcriptional regulator [Flavobacteriales bacterium]MDG2245208.1 MarR family transcriptional regulator [Flavobacteriales bacterium]
MKPEETIDFHIRWVWAKIARLYNVQASKHGGSMSIGYILLNIDKEGTHSTKLGPKMGMEARSLTRTLKTMEDNGLISRKVDKNDRRMVRVFLTSKGIAMREESRRVVLCFNEFMRAKIAPEKFEVFLEVMTDLNEFIDEPELFSKLEESENHPITNEKH